MPAVTGGSSTETLARRISGLVGRYTALSAQRTAQAAWYKAEASYLHGAASAFEIVAAELWEALGKHGPVPKVAGASHLSVLGDPAADGSSEPGNALRPEDPADATGASLDDGGT